MEGRRLASWVTHERLDDEVIAINLETGAYYAFEDAAADCWSLVVSGEPDEAIAEAMCARYEVDEQQAHVDVKSFVQELEHERLIESGAPGTDTHPVEPLPAGASRRPYTTPTAIKFDDLEELLLLDPIHEVDDSGWPVARQ